MAGYPVTLSVIVMAYNEELSIEAQVLATASWLRRATAGGQVVVVNDGSSDSTGRIADALAATDPSITVVHHPRNLGMGTAIRNGYAAARCDFVSQLPGDGQVVPETLERFLPFLADHELVLSTYARRDDGLLRRAVTTGYQATAWALLGDRCRFTGTMVFRREWLDRVRLACDSFMVNVELPLKLMRSGVKPAWVTIEALERAHGRSKVLSPGRVALVLREMLALRRELVLPS